MTHRTPSRARLWRVIVLAALLIVLVVLLFAPQAWSLRLPTNPDSTWLLLLLSTLSFLGIVILTFVLGRQTIKLYAERRARVLGAQFRTKLVIGALALSLTPVVCMFVFTYGLINRTLDKWFSQPVVAVRDDNQSTLAMLTGYVIDNARTEAQSIAASPAVETALASGNQPQLQQALRRHQQTLQGGFAAVWGANGPPLAQINWPAGYTSATAAGSGQLRIGDRTYALTRTRMAHGAGAIEVGMPIPATLTAQIARLAQDRDRYDQLARQRRSLRLIYTGYLLLLTLAILFCSTWMALYLSRLITVPIAELASATQEISRGNLTYRVRVGARDEIGTLVDSFNRMAGELEQNRQELEARRRYTEALLENTPSAVLSLSRGYAIERVNPAVERLFGAAGASPRHLNQLFDASSLREVQHLLRKSERWPQATGQLEVTSGGRRLTLAATAAALSGGAGFVLVLEDLTDLLHIQKTAAWREVAQRIAHEIKNPLTPIALSAERIHRRLAALPPDSPAAAWAGMGVVAECAATIASEVGSLQRLVDEFSTYARFPHAQPVDCDLNDIIERALRAFDGRLEGIEIRTRLDPLPPLRLDPEDMKRVFINLIDNAAEAMHHAPYRQLTLATQQLDGVVEAVVADTGHGLPADDKQRLFLPYYSTKQRGTGLGLAIVLRIVEENGGSLRAEDNTPLGARFIMELPLHAPQHSAVE